MLAPSQMTCGEETWLPASWYAERLRAAGFAAVAAVWRWGNDALLVAQR